MQYFIVCILSASEWIVSRFMALYNKLIIIYYYKLEINKNYKMTLINYSGGLKNGRCYSILGNVNDFTQGLDILA